MSSSIILTFGILHLSKILNSENCKFQLIDQNIYDDILFDRKLDLALFPNFNDGKIDKTRLDNKDYSNLREKMSKEKCFIKTLYGFGPDQSEILYVFKDFGIVQHMDNSNIWYTGNDRSYVLFNHNLPSRILFVSKYGENGDIIKLLDMYKDHPEYFNQNYTELEDMCKIEYNKVEKQKDEIIKERQLLNIEMNNFIFDIKIKIFICLIVIMFISFIIIIFSHIHKNNTPQTFYEI